jgi:tetratricopeptide (TPR) repeat protein
VAGNASFNSDNDLARLYWEQSLELCRSLGYDRGAAMILHRLALYPLDRGDLGEARRMIDESQTLAAGRSALVDAVNLWMYSEIASAEGNLEEAIDLSRRSVARASSIGWSWWVSGQRSNLARLAIRVGDLESAEREARAALRIAREHENRLRSAAATCAIAQVALARGQIDRAGLLWGSAELELSKAISRHDLAQDGGPLIDVLDPSFEAAVEQGRRLDLWDAVAIALGELEPPSP